KLIERLAGVAYDKRTARFRCVVAIADENGLCECVEGICNGTILEAERGGWVRVRSAFHRRWPDEDVRGAFAGSEEPHQPSREGDAESVGGVVPLPARAQRGRR